MTARLSCAGLCLGLLGACASLKEPPPLPASLEHAADEAQATLAAAPADAAWPDRTWWTAFDDPGFSATVTDALRGNPTVAAASARFRKAAAAAALAGAALQPQINANGSVVRERISANYIAPPIIGGTWQWQNQLQLTAAYTIDLWGKNRAAFESALGQRQAAALEASAAELTLTTGLAHAFIQLQRAYDQRGVAEATVEARVRVLELARSRVRAGLESQLDLKQAEAAVPAAREQLAGWDQAIALGRDRIAALAGWGPDRGAAVPRPQMANVRARLPSRIPAEILGRRPDVLAQRLRIEAAYADITAAKAEFYPNIDLTALAGFQSFGLSKFFEGGSFVAGAGPALTLPIFGGGRLRANLAGRRADADAAIAQYRETIAGALQEIADALASLRTVDAQTAEQAKAVGFAQEAYDLAMLRYKEGLGTYLQVLTAETALLSQKSLAVDLDAQARDLAVTIIGAVGGGVTAPASRS